MPLPKRLLFAGAQWIAATLAGMLAVTLIINFITNQFMAALGVSALVIAVVITGLGRLLRLHGTFDSALMGAGIGALIGFVVLFMGLSRDHNLLWVIAALIPALLGTITYLIGEKTLLTTEKQRDGGTEDDRLA